VEALKIKERQDETQFTTEIAEKKTSLDPNKFHFVKFSFPVTRLMPYYCPEADHSWDVIDNSIVSVPSSNFHT
jgi:hypothetical protein